MEVIFLNINVIGDMVVGFVICIVTFIIFRIEAVIFITFVFYIISMSYIYFWNIIWNRNIWSFIGVGLIIWELFTLFEMCGCTSKTKHSYNHSNSRTRPLFHLSRDHHNINPSVHQLCHFEADIYFCSTCSFLNIKYLFHFHSVDCNSFCSCLCWLKL